MFRGIDLLTLEQRGLSQGVVSGRAGISRSTVSRLESNLSVPTIETLVKVANSMQRDIGLLRLDSSAEERESNHHAVMGCKAQSSRPSQHAVPPQVSCALGVRPLNPSESALPNNTPMTRVQSAPTKLLGLESFRIHLQKRWGRGNLLTRIFLYARTPNTGSAGMLAGCCCSRRPASDLLVSAAIHPRP